MTWGIDVRRSFRKKMYNSFGVDRPCDGTDFDKQSLAENELINT